MKLLEVEFCIENIYQRVSLAWFSFFSYEDNVYMYRFHCSNYIDASFRIVVPACRERHVQLVTKYTSHEHTWIQSVVLQYEWAESIILGSVMCMYT